MNILNFLANIFTMNIGIIDTEFYYLKMMIFFDFIEFNCNDNKGIYLSAKRRYYLWTGELLFLDGDDDCFVQYDNKEDMKTKIAVLKEL